MSQYEYIHIDSLFIEEECSSKSRGKFSVNITKLSFKDFEVFALYLLFGGLVIFNEAYADHGPEHENPATAIGVNGSLHVSPSIIVDGGQVTYTYTGDGYPSWYNLRPASLYYIGSTGAFFRPVKWGNVIFSPVSGCVGDDLTCVLDVTVSRTEGEFAGGQFFPNCRAQYYLGYYPATDGGGSTAESKIALYVLGTDQTFDVQLGNPLTLSASGPIPQCPDVDPSTPTEPIFEYSCSSTSPYDYVDFEVVKDGQGKIDGYAGFVQDLCSELPVDDPGECIEQSFVTWNWGDGSPLDFAGLDNNHTYEGSGVFNVSVRGEGFVEQDGEFFGFDETVNCELILRPPSLSVKLTPFGATTAINGQGEKQKEAVVDEPFSVQLKVSASDGFGDISNIQFANPDDPLELTPEGLFELTVAPELPSLPASLDPNEVLFDEVFEVKALSGGAGFVDAPMTYTAEGVSKTANDKEEIKINGGVFDIAVAITPEDLVVGTTLPEDALQECKDYNVEITPILPDPLDPPDYAYDCLKIVATVKNTAKVAVENVLADSVTAQNILRGIKSLDPESINVPLRQIRSVVATTTDGVPLTGAITLESEESFKLTWIVDAFGSAPILEAEVVVTGSIEGESVRDVGRNTFSVVEDPIVKFGVRTLDPVAGKFSGSGVALEGFIENLSTEEHIGVTVMTFLEGNAGRGILYERGAVPGVVRPRANCRNFPEVNYVGLPTIAQGFRLLPREAVEGSPIPRIDLEGILATVCRDVTTDAKITYLVEAFVLAKDDNGDLVLDDEGFPTQVRRISDQIQIEKEDRYSRKINVPLAPNPVLEEDPSSFCDNLIYSPIEHISCQTGRGVYSAIVGFIELGPLLKNVAIQDYDYAVRLLSHMSQLYREIREAQKLGDPLRAQQILIDELTLDMNSLMQAGVITGGQARAAAIAAVAKVDELFRLAAEGNFTEFAGALAFVAGENFDAFLSVGLVKSATSKMVKGVSNTADQLDGIAKVVKENMDKLAKSHTDTAVRDARYAQADGPLATSGKVKAGDVLDYNLIHKHWGAPEEFVRAVEDICDKYNININFRSRGLKAIELVQQGIAYVKPQGMKLKSVNELDIKYLGYPETRKLNGSAHGAASGTKDTVLFVEPPFDLHKSIDELKTIDKWDESPEFELVLDNWMNTVRPKVTRPPFGEATDSMLYTQIKNRARTRAAEWVKYSGEYADVARKSDIPLGFGYKHQGATSGFDVLDKGYYQRVDLKKTELDRTEFGNRRVIDIELNGPDGFKVITGDVDIVSILNMDGTFILNPFKRWRIYRDMQKIGMQHGESFSFTLKTAIKNKFLDAHVLGKEGAEALVSIGRGKAKRAAYFLENQVVVADRLNGVKNTGAQGMYIPVVGAEQTIRTTKSIIGQINTLASYSKQLDKFEAALARIFTSLTVIRDVFELSESEVPKVFDANSDSVDTQVVQYREGEIKRYGVDPSAGLVTQNKIVTLGFGAVVEVVPLQWYSVSVEEAKAGDAQITSLPVTATAEQIDPLTYTFEVVTLAEMQMLDTSNFFNVGDFVVIDPGGENEEFNIVSYANPMKLIQPLINIHATGTVIAVVPARFVLTEPTDPNTIDTDGDGTVDVLDAFPLDPTEQFDSDGDGVGDNADAFPLDASETQDSDGDGVGDNADAFPLDPTETLDTDGDGIGNNADDDDDGDGVLDLDDNCPLVQNMNQEDADQNMIGDACDPGNTIGCDFYIVPSQKGMSILCL